MLPKDTSGPARARKSSTALDTMLRKLCRTSAIKKYMLKHKQLITNFITLSLKGLRWHIIKKHAFHSLYTTSEQTYKSMYKLHQTIHMNMSTM